MQSDKLYRLLSITCYEPECKSPSQLFDLKEAVLAIGIFSFQKNRCLPECFFLEVYCSIDMWLAHLIIHTHIALSAVRKNAEKRQLLVCTSYWYFRREATLVFFRMLKRNYPCTILFVLYVCRRVTILQINLKIWPSMFWRLIFFCLITWS